LPSLCELEPRQGPFLIPCITTSNKGSNWPKQAFSNTSIILSHQNLCSGLSYHPKPGAFRTVYSRKFYLPSLVMTLQG